MNIVSERWHLELQVWNGIIIKDVVIQVTEDNRLQYQNHT